jgi:hypothetical protein
MLIAVMVVAGASSALADLLATHTGNIASGAQFDLYYLDLEKGAPIIATLVCDFDGVSRPLDPVLSVYFPGSDPSDTINADVYNDDGFGQDDDPGGVDCDAFDSSRVIFTTPVSGTFIFRADGFGSATGPYTLKIYVTPGGCDVLVPVTSSSVVGTFNSNTQAYWAPGELTSPAVVLEAGKTAWVLGVDSSGQYYKIVWSCDLLWVPVGSMGPNFDEVWNGTPLPTNVVDSEGEK